MSPRPLSESKSLAQDLSGHPDKISLVVNLTAAPSARLTKDIGVILKRTFERPFTFMGSVGNNFELDLQLSDPGLKATETLARRLLKLKGVRKVSAERRCSRRGAIYVISLRSSA